MNDRKNLFLPMSRFLDITRKITEKDVESERIKKEQEIIQKRREEISAMVKQWPDSIENIRFRETERREMKTKQHEQLFSEKLNFFREFRKNEREKFLEAARRKYSIVNRPNLLLSKALLETQVYAENDAILKLKAEILQKDMKLEKQWADRINEDVKNYKIEQENKNCKIREKAKLCQKYQLEQMKEKEERNSNKLTIEEGKKELENLARTDEEIKQMKRENDFEKFMGVKKIMKTHYEYKNRLKHEVDNEDHELTLVTQLYNNHYTKRQCGIKKQYKDEIKKTIEDRWKSGKNYREKIKIRNDDVFYVNGMLKNEEKYRERQAEEANKREAAINDRLNDYNQDKNKKKIEKTTEEEMTKYQLAERLKAAEETKKYDLQMIKKRRNVNVEHIQQMNGFIEEKIPEKPEMDQYKEQDDKFFNYANEVLGHARQRGRSEYPIKKVINKYCKQNLLPIHELCLDVKKPETLQESNFQLELPELLKKLRNQRSA